MMQTTKLIKTYRSKFIDHVFISIAVYIIRYTPTLSETRKMTIHDIDDKTDENLYIKIHASCFHQHRRLYRQIYTRNKRNQENHDRYRSMIKTTKLMKTYESKSVDHLFISIAVYINYCQLTN